MSTNTNNVSSTNADSNATPFADLGLSPALLKSLELAGYTTATPIQAQAIPHILAGHDLLGTAQTGTGKTAAFALPTLQRVAELKNASGTNKSVIRCLVLTPTRELALQVNTSFNKYGRSGVGGAGGLGTPLRFASVFGGVNQFRQVEAIKSGVDILVATPGRLEDLQNQGHIDLSHVELFILDEADQMLDMGFIVPIRRVSKTLKKERQTLMFSATMPREIQRLASEVLKKGYTEVSVAPAGTTAATVTQQVFFIDKNSKGTLLRHFLADNNLVDGGKSLVFSKTKHGADRIARGLQKSGITAAAIHGNRSQAQRNRALDAFKKGDVAVLVATDVAARGLHISEVSHVINFDLPMTAETYVHRIGRTGRAGATGIAVSFVDNQDRGMLRDVERHLKKKLDVIPTPELPALTAEEHHAFHSRNEDNDDWRSDQRKLPANDRRAERGLPIRPNRAPQGGNREGNFGGNNFNNREGNFNRDGGNRQDNRQSNFRPSFRGDNFRPEAPRQEAGSENFRQENFRPDNRPHQPRAEGFNDGTIQRRGNGNFRNAPTPDTRPAFKAGKPPRPQRDNNGNFSRPLNNREGGQGNFRPNRPAPTGDQAAFTPRTDRPQNQHRRQNEEAPRFAKAARPKTGKPGAGAKFNKRPSFQRNG